jgi:hypothetical protein
MSRTTYEPFVEAMVNEGATPEDIAASLRTEFPEITVSEAAQAINYMTALRRQTSFQPQAFMAHKAELVFSDGAAVAKENLNPDPVVEDAAYRAWLLRLAFPDANSLDIAEPIQDSFPNLTTTQMAQVLKHNSNHPVFPDLEPVLMATTLVDPGLGSATFAEVAAALHSPGVYPDLKAYAMGQVLKTTSVFPNITKEDMTAALKAAGYAQAEIDSAIAQLFPPPAPTISSLAFADGKATAAWNKVDGNDGYQVHLVDSQGKEIGAAIDVAKDVQTGAIPLPPDLAAGNYFAQALTKIPDGSVSAGDWGPLSTVFLQKLAAPVVTILIFADGNAAATWNKVDGNDGYRLRLVDGKGEEIGLAIDVAKDIQTGAVTMPPDAAAGNYFAQVLAKAKDSSVIPSNWSPSSTAFLQKLAASSVSALSVSGGKVTVSWNKIDGNDGYQTRLVDSQGKAIGATIDAAKDVQSAAIEVPTDMPSGNYFAQVITKATGTAVLPSDWSSSSTPSLQKLAVPTVATLSVADGKVNAAWNKVDGNDGYQLRLVDSKGEQMGTVLDVVKDTQTAAMTVPPDLAAGNYFAQVMTQATGATTIPSGWSASSTASIQKLAAPTVATPTFADDKITSTWNRVDGNGGYQVRLSLVPTSGEAIDLTQDAPKDAQSAIVALPPNAPSGKCTIQLMTKAAGDAAISSSLSVPQTIDIDTLTPESFAQQLKAAGKTAVQAASLIKTKFPPLDLPSLATVLYTVFQPPGLTQTETALALVVAFPVPPLDATSLARALVTVYPFTTPVTSDALTSTAQALKAVGFTRDQAADALKAAYDPSATLLAAVLNQVFGPDLTPELLAQQLKADGKTAAQAATLVKTKFPELDLPTLATVVYKVFQPPNLTQTELSLALVGAFPIPPLDASTLARALVAVYPFTKPVTSDALTATAQALKTVGFTMDQAAVGLAAAYDRPSPVLLATVLKLVFIGPDLLKFDGSGTSVTLSKTNYDQMGYRDSGHQNQLVDLANIGFTIDASIYPEALDDCPIVTLIYENNGSQWKAGDLTVELSLFNGRVRVSALTPDWNAGIPSDPRLVTLTTAISVALKQWSNITITWEGGMVGVHVNGQAQNLDVQNNHDNWNPYNAANFVGNGMRAAVGTFVPDCHRFIFGKYKDRFFKGYIKNVRIWRGARVTDDIKQEQYNRLTDAEIAAAQSTVRGAPWSPVYLGGYWPLDEGSGNVAPDLTQVRNDGNIANPAWAQPDN